MSDRRVGCAFAAVLIVAFLAIAPVKARATQRFGPLQLSGNVQSQNLVRTPDQSTYEYIMNRNTAHIQLTYDWLQGGMFYGKYNIPFIETSKLFLLWRGVYDSIYDTTPGFIEKEDIHGRAYQGLNVFDYGRKVAGLPRSAFTVSGLPLDARNALKFENTLREAYADIRFRNLPLNVRAGRQQIVWGETDNFRMLDRANTLDLTWHFQQEFPAPAYGWDEIRRPFWMIKFLYDLGDIWKFSQNFLEWYWNPGDWYPAKQAFLPRPWGLRFFDPLTNPVDGAFILGVCSASPFKTAGGFNTCTRLMNGTQLFKQGDYSRNPFDNSQVGIRYHAISPQSIEFTLNYFYQRWGGDDGTNYAPIRGIQSARGRLPLDQAHAADSAVLSSFTSRGIFPAEFITPYIHTVGASANYSDETYTQAVFRFETIYDFGIPFFDVGKVTIIDVPSLPGVTKKNMWKGMIAFDRPTWIKRINKKSTVFLTGQFFWHYLVDRPNCDPQVVAQIPPDQRFKAGSCLVGGLDLPSRVRSSSLAFRDKIRDWETIFTLAGFTFYRGGSVVPVLGIAVDPVNQFSMEPFWTLDYFLTTDIAVNVGQKYFVAPRGESTPIFESWGLAGLNKGRSETNVRLTFQF